MDDPLKQPIAIIDTENQTCLTLDNSKMFGDVPPTLESHTIVKANNSYFLFGGSKVEKQNEENEKNEGENSISFPENELYIFEISGTTIRDIQIHFRKIELENPLPPMSSHCSTLFFGEFLMFFGGETYNPKSNLDASPDDRIKIVNHIHSLNIRTLKWFEVKVQEKSFTFSPRIATAACVISEQIFLFGGLLNDNTFNNQLLRMKVFMTPNLLSAYQLLHEHNKVKKAFEACQLCNKHQEKPLKTPPYSFPLLFKATSSYIIKKLKRRLQFMLINSYKLDQSSPIVALLASYLKQNSHYKQQFNLEIIKTEIQPISSRINKWNIADKTIFKLSGRREMEADSEENSSMDDNRSMDSQDTIPQSHTPQSLENDQYSNGYSRKKKKLNSDEAEFSEDDESIWEFGDSLIEEANTAARRVELMQKSQVMDDFENSNYLLFKSSQELRSYEEYIREMDTDHFVKNNCMPNHVYETLFRCLTIGMGCLMVRKCENSVYTLIYVRKVLRYHQIFSYDVDVVVIRLEALRHYLYSMYKEYPMTDEIQSIRKLISKLEHHFTFDSLVQTIIQEEYEAFDYVFECKTIFQKSDGKTGINIKINDLDSGFMMTRKIDTITQLVKLTNPLEMKKINITEKVFRRVKTAVGRFKEIPPHSESRHEIQQSENLFFNILDMINQKYPDFVVHTNLKDGFKISIYNINQIFLKLRRLQNVTAHLELFTFLGTYLDGCVLVYHNHILKNIVSARIDAVFQGSKDNKFVAFLIDSKNDYDYDVCMNSMRHAFLPSEVREV